MVRELSRRNALRGAATAAVLGAGLGAPPPTTSAQAEPARATRPGRVQSLGNQRLPAPNLSPLLFHSPRVRPFVEELPGLPVLSGSTIDLAATVRTHSFHPEYGETPTFGYGSASYLGPVIDAHRDDELTLRFHNRLTQHIFAEDIDTTIHGAVEQDRFAPPSVLHLHGGATPPASDGSPEASILPGRRYTYRYPLQQEAATLWYHDHTLGITRLNVYAGLASLFLLRDRWDTGHADNPLGLPAGEFEWPLVLQEKIFTSDGAPSMRSTPIVPRGSWEGGATGDVGLVNGKVWPEMTVARGLYRFRVLNGASFSTWNLFFSNRMRFWVIGTDGGLLNAPVSTTAVRLAPAERADLLVDFSGLTPHTRVELRNDETVPGQAAILGEVPMPVFCRFRAGSGTGFRGQVPARLRGVRHRPPRLPPPQRPHRVRNLTIGQPSELRMPPSIMLLNNIRFTSDQIEMPRQGSVEQWNLINLTPDPHPIHLHLVMFRVLGRQSFDADAYQLHHPRPPTGAKWNPSAASFLTGRLRPPRAWESGRKDTVLADGHTVTSIVIRFPTAEELGFDPDATFPAPEQHGKRLQGYMWHCHILDHEDHDMMLRYRTIAA